MTAELRTLLSLSLVLAGVQGMASPGTAQATQVVPKAFAAKEGASFTSFPFGRSTSVLVQQGYGAALFAARSATIRKVGLRPDGGRALKAKGIDLEIALGSLPTSGALKSAFALNRGSDYRVAFARRRVSLPAASSSAGPRAFNIEFALDKAFVFDARKSGLLVEFRVYGQQSGRYEIDLDASCTSERKDFGKPACKGSNGKFPKADCPTAALVPGKRFTLRVSGLRHNDLALGFLGSRESGPWQGFVLPLSLSRFGAPGCWLNTDILVNAGGVVNVAGELRLPGQVPNIPRVVGLWLRFQGVAVDTQANALGLSFSNGHKIRVCAVPPMSRVVATSLQASTGTLEFGLVPVTRIVE